MDPVRVLATVRQDYVSMGEVFNVQWNCLYEHFGKFYRMNRAISVSDEKIADIFDSIPKGIDSELCSILDQGYKIKVRASDLGVRRLWIWKEPDTNLESMYVPAGNMYDVFQIAIEIFNATLNSHTPFEFTDWFGKNKRFPDFQWGDLDVTVLDFLVNNMGVDLIFSKTSEEMYKLDFENMDKEQIEILFKRFTIC
jgi:hypothetical protein